MERRSPTTGQNHLIKATAIAPALTEEARKPETRANRIVKAVERLASGRGQR